MNRTPIGDGERCHRPPGHEGDCAPEPLNETEWDQVTAAQRIYDETRAQTVLGFIPGRPRRPPLDHCNKALPGAGNRYPAGAWIEHPAGPEGDVQRCARCEIRLDGLRFAPGSTVYQKRNVWTTTKPAGSHTVPCFPAVPAHRRTS